MFTFVSICCKCVCGCGWVSERELVSACIWFGKGVCIKSKNGGASKEFAKKENLNAKKWVFKKRADAK